MARAASLEPYKSKTASSARPWCVDVPPNLSDTGKRKRLFFSKKTEATLECEKLKTRRDNFGVSLNTMSPARIAIAAEAFNLLDPQGIDLLEAVRAYLEDLRHKTASVTFGTAFDRFAELKREKSENYRQEIRHAKAKFEPLLEVPICDIKAQDLEPILDSLPDSSRNAKMRRLRSVFNLAIKRGWMKPGTSPIARLDFAEPSVKEVQIYSMDEVERILLHSLNNDLDLLPFLVLGLFCGIRPDGELQKLEWSAVRFDGDKPQVVIPPEVSKMKRRRFVDLSPNAVTWLEAYRRDGGSMEGKIVPFGFNVLRKKRRKNQAEAKIGRWIQQGMRHSFCTYWLAQHKDVNQLVLQSGHTDADTMWRHYHRGVTEAEARKFWSIVPPKTDAKVIPFPEAKQA